MSRSTLSISAGLAVAAVVLAGLWVSYGPRPHASRDRQASTTTPVSKQDRSGIDPQGEAIRSVYPGPSSGSAQRAAPAPRTGMAAPPPSAAATPAAPPDAPTVRGAAPPPTPPQQQADSASGQGQPPASPGQGVDLNTASVEELNALGAGMIGRRIIAFRPYGSPEDLVTRRVLKKADYEAIKAAVAVRQTDPAGTDRPD
ncbi:helix-hairpin-helix domain-containing protein (plasmid) [Methylobacterium sp. NMS12]|uniref:helix-hairpin-helix domain-containing protein n=1 Tax=Methylobacterium sp. NMS12 TaxID=3079766 RepID=UPI003F8803D1